jgi:hypothetical protein
MRRILTAFALLACALPAMALSFPTPTATLTRFEVTAISLRDVTFLFELTVKNPYPITLSFNGMNLAFKVEGPRCSPRNPAAGSAFRETERRRIRSR